MSPSKFEPAKHEEISGIQEVHCPDPPEAAEVDIVAVHGLGEGALRTWTTASDICWLNNPEFLPKYLNSARVLVWGYNADLTSRNGGRPSKDRIHHLAQTLVANLGADRRVWPSLVVFLVCPVNIDSSSSPVGLISPSSFSAILSAGSSSNG